MNTSIILLIVGVFLAVGVIIYFLTRHKKTTVSTKSVSNTQDMIIGDENVNVTIPVLISMDGNYSLKPQDDANLVVYDKAGKYYWNSYFTNEGNFPRCDPVNSCTYTTQLQPDGNLVTYSSKNNTSGTNVTWSAAGYPGTNFKRRSDSSAPYALKFYNNGQLGIYDSNNNVIWSSGDVPDHITPNPFPNPTPPQPFPKCSSGPDFTGKTWKNIYDTNSNILKISFDKDNASNILLVDDLYIIYSSNDKGKTWKQYDKSKFDNNEVFTIRVFKNYQIAMDVASNIYISKDMFETIEKKYNIGQILPNGSGVINGIFYKLSNMTIAGSNKGDILYIPISNLNTNNFGILKINIDSSYNITGKYIDFQNKSVLGIDCSEDGKIIYAVTVLNNSNSVFENDVLVSLDEGETWKNTFSNIFPITYNLQNVNIKVERKGSYALYSAYFFPLLFPKPGDTPITFIKKTYNNGETWQDSDIFNSSVKSFGDTGFDILDNGWKQVAISSGNSSHNVEIYFTRNMLNGSSFNINFNNNFNKFYDNKSVKMSDNGDIFVCIGNNLWSLE